MGSRTATNWPFKGLQERIKIEAEVCERDGKKYAKVRGIVPIHCCTKEEVEKLSESTHHYCDIFSDEVLAPLEELAYVRLDDEIAEKVFVNRSKRILVTSSDGRLAQWRCAPTFESGNDYVAGTPLVNQSGQVVSVVTARRGNHYAVSCFDGDGGYFSSAHGWEVKRVPAGAVSYGARVFESRDQLRAALGSPRPAPSQPTVAAETRPLILLGSKLRLSLVQGDEQLAHLYIQNVAADEVQYL